VKIDWKKSLICPRLQRLQLVKTDPEFVLIFSNLLVVAEKIGQKEDTKSKQGQIFKIFEI
jgi:hypothetical protein